nr:unnamed protein product [Callosobruchus chinensis]
MPHTCCVPKCNGNTKHGLKVHMFGFPSDPILRQKWIAAVPRENFTPVSSSKVCNLHFIPEHLVWTVSQQDSKTGKIVSAPLIKPRLYKNAVPSVFPNCPKYFNKEIHFRKSRDEKLKDLEEQQLLTVIEESRAENIAYQKLICFQNFEEFLTKFTNIKLGKGWFTIRDETRLSFCRIDNIPGPVITYSVVVQSDLEVKAFLFGNPVNTSGTKLPFTTNNIIDIQNLIDMLDKLLSKSDSQFDKFKLKKDITNHVCELLTTLKQIDDSDGSSEESLDISFLIEQLKLYNTPKQRYRYSAKSLILCSVIHLISPHAYKYLRHSGTVILPHSKTLKTICNKFLTDPTIEEKQSFLMYAKNVAKYLEDREKNVILLIDEVHIEPFVDYKGGNIVGTACNNHNELATTAYAFMINSVFSSFKEVVHISPISKIDYKILHSFLDKVIKGLEEIGYRLFCIISDNNAINGKAVSQFSDNKQLSIVYPHPFDRTRPLFFLFDSVHLLKCIRNNWINLKSQQKLIYPDFDGNSKTSNIADFAALKKLHEIESAKLLKFGYGLTLKALHPTNLERQNVKLALKVFNCFVAEGLLQFQNEISHSVETSNFINIVLRWWKIVNVKTPLKGRRLKDPYQEPVVNKNDFKLIFLGKMLTWLDTWKSNGSNQNKMSSQTHTALTHTVYGLIEITKYCMEELNMNYVLLGKFQTDPLEHRFGKYRQLAGGHYNISIRQLYESEKRLRIQSLLTLKSKTFGNISIESFCERIDDSDGQSDGNIFIPHIELSEKDFDEVEQEMPVVTYLAGYCCFITSRKLKCQSCNEILVLPEEFVIEDNFSLIHNLNRGSLFFPQQSVTSIVLHAYVLFNVILRDHEDDFLAVFNKRSFLINFILEHLDENKLIEDLTIFSSPCSNHNNKEITTYILRSCINTFFNNYCGKKNNRVGKSNKRKLATLTDK